VVRSWWWTKPWQRPDNLLRFWGHVGMYEGRAALARNPVQEIGG